MAAIVGVVVSGLLLWGVTVYASKGHGRGDLAIRDEFRVGSVAALVDRVPFLLPDATPGRSVDVYVQHDPGRPVDEGWLVFSAFALGQTDRSCFLRYEEDDDVFRDPCTGAEFPASGAGLRQYPTRVDDDDRLHVDLSP